MNIADNPGAQNAVGISNRGITTLRILNLIINQPPLLPVMVPNALLISYLNTDDTVYKLF